MSKLEIWESQADLGILIHPQEIEEKIQQDHVQQTTAQGVLTQQVMDNSSLMKRLELVERRLNIRFENDFESIDIVEDNDSKFDLIRKQRSWRRRSKFDLRASLRSFRNCDDVCDEGIEEGDEWLYRLHVDIKEGIATPSVFLIKALNIARNVWMLDLLCGLVLFLQIWYPVWFASSILHRKNFTFIAPGFHSATYGTIRERWRHNFAVDVSSSVFLSYIAWSTWQQRQIQVFRFYLRAKSSRFRRGILIIGILAHTIAIFAVLILTYILFRLEPEIHEVLLNAVALDFLHKLDLSVCSTFTHHTQLHLLLRRCKDELITEADQIVENGALTELQQLKLMHFRNLLSLPVTLEKMTELYSRILKRVYMFVSAVLIILSFTGGHIAHTHLRNVLWYFNLVKHRQGSETSKWMGPLIRKGAKDADKKYAFVAILMSSVVVSIIFICGRLVIRTIYGPQDDLLWVQSDGEWRLRSKKGNSISWSNRFSSKFRSTKQRQYVNEKESCEEIDENYIST